MPCSPFPGQKKKEEAIDFWSGRKPDSSTLDKKKKGKKKGAFSARQRRTEKKKGRRFHRSAAGIRRKGTLCTLAPVKEKKKGDWPDTFLRGGRKKRKKRKEAT